MLENGFVKVHRSLLNWEWYHDVNTCRLFLHLILTVNYEDKKWQGIVIKRGQRVASYTTLASETDLSVKAVRTALKHLKETGEVASTSNTKYSVITIINYEKYQDMASTTASCGQAEGKQGADQGQARGNNERKIKKDKKDKKVKEINNNKEHLSFDSVPFEIIDAVKCFVEYRKEIKSPMTQKALDLMIAKLTKMTRDINQQKEILNQSIMNGWKGIFPLKEGGNKYEHKGNTGETEEPLIGTVIRFDE